MSDVNLTRSSFETDPFFLEAVENNDPIEQFLIGLQARSEKHYGFALGFFNLAEKNGHPEAKQALTETRQQLFQQVNG